MNLKLLICFLLLMPKAHALFDETANSAISEIDKIFDAKEITIEVRYYGGINPGIVAKSFIKISTKTHSTFSLVYINKDGSKNNKELELRDKHALKDMFKDLVLNQTQNRIMMGNCTHFDTTYVLIGNGKKVEIQPGPTEFKFAAIESWLQKLFI